MTERELAAYALLTIMLIAVAGAITWSRYNSRDRKNARRKVRNGDRYRERRALIDNGAIQSESPPGSGEA